MAKQMIIEHLQTGGYPTKRWRETDTEYLGRDASSGLHRFREDGTVGLYAKRRQPISGHQIVRGAHFYEFCRSEG